jgi:hypothetical protein
MSDEDRLFVKSYEEFRQKEFTKNEYKVIFHPLVLDLVIAFISLKNKEKTNSRRDKNSFWLSSVTKNSRKHFLYSAEK